MMATAMHDCAVRYLEILELFQEQLGMTAEETAELALDEELEDLGLDSLDWIELVMAAEEKFGIEIPDEAAMRVRTLRDCETLLVERLAR